MERETLSFKSRIREVRERGYGCGINGLKSKEHLTELVGDFMYSKEEKKVSRNVYLAALFEDSYQKGCMDRAHVVSICPKDRPRFSMTVLKKAFECGRNWRRHSDIMELEKDKAGYELLKSVLYNPDFSWTWIRGEAMAVTDCWAAGFEYEGEEMFGRR